jgi:D-alanyl-D-alanine carboxypeptidase
MPLPPASTTKLVTAVVAMKSGRLDRNVKVSRHASSMQPSKIWLQPGWTMNMEDLVYAMLVKSGNDASVVVAEGLAGSVQSFSNQMNTTVRSLGGQNSHFVNPNGLPAKGHYSSASDLALVVRHALAIPKMREILSTRTKTITPRSGSQRKIHLTTTNRLLGNRSFQLIGKTGYTRLAKRCFAGAASLGGREVIVVVLGSTNLWGDLDLLVDYGLKPEGKQPGWSQPTGWQQARAGKPKSLVPAAEPVAPVAIAQPKRGSGVEIAQGDRGPVAEIAQGDRGRVSADPVFRFHVQVASLRSKTIAQDLLRKVASRGYSASIEPSSTQGAVHYRVLVRDLADRVIARRVARDISRDLNVETQIIAVRG